eukprot:5483473-Prymnesium_polylepis.2
MRPHESNGELTQVAGASAPPVLGAIPAQRAGADSRLFARSNGCLPGRPALSSSMRTQCEVRPLPSLRRAICARLACESSSSLAATSAKREARPCRGAPSVYARARSSLRGSEQALTRWALNASVEPSSRSRDHAGSD